MKCIARSGLVRFLALAAAFFVGPLAHAAPSNVAAWRFEDGSHTGSTVGTAGDFNCDGISDLLLGNELGSISTFDALSGWVGIWFGSATLPPQPNEPPDWRVFGTGVPFTFDDGAMLGAVSAAGDVNRDGCDDVIVASRQGGGAGANVRAYFGSAVGPSTSPGWLRFLLGSGGEVESLATGDVNGDGTTDIIAGIPEADFGQNDEGAVLVWLGSQFLGGVTGTLGFDWMAQSNQIGAELGRSVAAGDVNGDGRDDVVAGAPLWDYTAPPVYTNTGRAFMWQGAPLFESTADGIPGNAHWSHLVGGNNTQLAFSVAVPGDVDGDGIADIVMGGPTFDNVNNAGTNEGTVVVTRGASPQPVSDLHNWFHVGIASGGQLGFAVASAGDVNGDGRAEYLIGEPGTSVSASRRGRVHLLLGRATTSWTINPVTDVVFSEESTFASDAVLHQYGAKLGTAGDWNGDGYSDVVISVQRVSFPVTSGGKAFVYLGRGDTLASSPVGALRSGQAGATNGLGVAFAGDINDDGFSDVVSGAPNWDGGEGAIFVAYGGPCGLDCPPFFEFGQREGGQAGMNFGWTVSSAGDVNGDGYADVIAGAPLTDNDFFPCPIFQVCTRTDAGSAVLYLGGPGGLSFSASWGATGGNSATAQFGYSVANAGDVNGDGFGDVIVGAPYQDVNGTDSGRVFLYLGTASGLSAGPSWIQTGAIANARFGIDVAGAGDVNADGFSDVIIGAIGQGASGSAYVYLGRPTTPTFPQGLGNTPIRTLVGIQANSAFGITVATAGDVNRDGFADVVVGAPELDDEPDIGPQIGAVFVYHGALGGPPANASTSIFGAFPANFSNRFGNGVAGAGDVNGDGFDDLVVGDQWSEGPAGFAQGRAEIFHGSASGVATLSARSLQDCPHGFCDFGRDVAGQGDINGDGFSDVLIGGYGNTSTFVNEGAVFVHLGNEGRSRPVRPRQSLAFGGAPRATLGITPDNFDVSADRRTPAGRGRVELEVEVKPLGQDFDGAGLLKSGMVDSSFEPRAVVSRLFNNPGDKFHWRARLRSISPLFGRSRWVSLPENGARELDIRVVPEPGIAVAIAVGIGGLAAIGRARRSRREG